MVEAGALLTRAFKVHTAQIDLRAVFFGYASPHGYQIAVLMIPPKVADDDPRLQIATNYVQSLAAAHFDFAVAGGVAGRGADGADAEPRAAARPADVCRGPAIRSCSRVRSCRRTATCRSRAPGS